MNSRTSVDSGNAVCYSNVGTIFHRGKNGKHQTKQCGKGYNENDYLRI